MATETVQMKVSGLMCSFCTMSVEKALKRYPGVKSVLVNLVHGIVLIEADTTQTSRRDLAEAVEKLGYSVSSTEVQQYETDEALFGLIKQRGMIGMALSLLDLIVDPLNLFGLPAYPRALFSLAVASFVLFWVGFPILRKTLMAVGQRVINANVLLSAGAWGSYIVGALSLYDPRWPNFLPVAAWLMSLHLFFGYFKLDTRRKASEAVRKLMSLQPPRARVLRGGEPVEVLTKDVAVGEVVLVRPGERIPLDGEVIEGTASVDESSFTGESVPVTKEAHSKVIGGIKVTKVGEDSFLNQIVRLMSQIAERKPSIELMADWLMNFYGPVVFVAAFLAFAGWMIATGDPLQATVVLLTTIIMGYPCALGITTPMLAAIAGGKGISIGLLVKASEVFHGLSTVNTVVFDKTGTLTYGRPTVTDVETFGLERAEVLALAGAVESQSEHPLGQAIGFYAEREGAMKHPVLGFRATPGKGVSATLDGAEILAGKPSFLEERGISFTEEVRAAIERLGAQGKTVVVIARGGDVVGAIALQDTPRRGAERVIARLKERGVRTVMLTGDARRVAEAIGGALGIDEVRAELLPADKVAAIDQRRPGARPGGRRHRHRRGHGRGHRVGGRDPHRRPARRRGQRAHAGEGELQDPHRERDRRRALQPGGDDACGLRVHHAAARHHLHGREHLRDPPQHAPHPGHRPRAGGGGRLRAACRAGAPHPEHGLRGLREQNQWRPHGDTGCAGSEAEGGTEERHRAVRAREGTGAGRQGGRREGRIHRGGGLKPWNSRRMASGSMGRWHGGRRSRSSSTVFRSGPSRARASPRPSSRTGGGRCGRPHVGASPAGCTAASAPASTA